MDTSTKWSDTGTPILTPAEAAGLKDFWKIYTKHEKEIYAALLKQCETLPDLATVLRGMTPAEQEAQNQRSREAMQRAIEGGDWAPLLALQREQGKAYAALGVRFREWFELIGDFQKIIVPYLIAQHHADHARLAAAILGANRYIDISMSIIAEEYLAAKEMRISQQQLAIHELSTPVLQVRERMLLLPIIGVLDTQRARLLTEQLLRAIRTNRAKAVVIDITGVAAVDSRVANHLLQTVAAAKLMGALVIVTGLSPEVAQALVTLGVDLRSIRTVGDLQGGLEEAELCLRAPRGQGPILLGQEVTPLGQSRGRE